MPEHRVEAIANEFIARARADGRSLTNMQLQKLPYIAHGWDLALADDRLIVDRPQAYPYGPVYRRLYDALKRYGAGNVVDFIRENDGTATEDFGGDRGEPITAALSADEVNLLNAVWNAYKRYHAYQLSEMTHQPDSPWTITTRDRGPYAFIDDALIRQHFVNLAARRRATA